MKLRFFSGLSSALYDRIAETIEKTHTTAEASRLRIQIESLTEELNIRYAALGKEYYHILTNSDIKGNNNACLSIGRLTAKLDELSKRLKNLEPECPEDRSYVIQNQPDIMEEPAIPLSPISVLEDMTDEPPDFTPLPRVKIKIRTKNEKRPEA